VTMTDVRPATRTRPRLGDRAVATVTRLIDRGAPDGRNEKRTGRRAEARGGVNRRSFLVRTAIFASALVVNPLRYLLRPGSAYAVVCGGDPSCSSGWTAFCCTVNNGQNSCPPGTNPAGWWKADNSAFCHSGPRYYIDCNASCGTCGCGGSGLCDRGCAACNCHCASGECDQRFTCCNEFRYGQCHQDLACVGPIVCRVVTCVAPWDFDATCSTTSATANSTGSHDAPCLHGFNSSVLAFGAAADHGEPRGQLPAPIVGIEATPRGSGYWLVGRDGGVFSFGDARFHGSTGGRRLNKPILDIARTRSGDGYWLVASDGGVFSFGDARFFGSMGAVRLNQPIVGIASTPTGNGYWMVAADGGVFSFGDARFFGSMGGQHLNRPIVGMAGTATGKGYWLVASDGGIFCFGDARFRGSAAGSPLNRPIVGMAATPTGKGYWFVAADGGISTFGDAHFMGSGANRLHAGSATDMAARPDGQGYWIATDT
jgi:hypothetical protein